MIINEYRLLSLWTDGKTLKEIGDEFGVSKQYIHILLSAIYKRHGSRFFSTKRQRASKISRMRIGKGMRIGPMYRRVRNMYEYRLWRNDILTRDNFSCQECFSTEKLQVDHIIPFSYILRNYGISSIEEARECLVLWDLENGRTLCRDCHMKTDTFAGRASKYVK